MHVSSDIQCRYKGSANVWRVPVTKIGCNLMKFPDLCAFYEWHYMQNKQKGKEQFARVLVCGCWKH